MYDDLGLAVPLSEVMADADLGLEQVGGPTDDVLVHSVGTTELSDPAPYVMPGELLLTSGMGLPAGRAQLGVYVARLAEVGIAAIGIGIQPVLDEVPPQLVHACEQHGLRLLRLPPRTPFAAVSQSFSHAMARRAQGEFEREAQAQGALVGAAGGADPIRGIVRQLARWIDSSVVLMDPEGNQLAVGGRAQPAPVLQIMREHAATLQHADSDHAAAAAFGTRLHVRLHAVPTGSAAGSRLILGVAGGEAPTLSQRRTIASCLWLLAVLVSPRYTLDARVEGIGALVRLLSGTAGADLDAMLRRGAGAAGEHWVVVRGRTAVLAHSPRARDTSVDVATLRTLLRTPYLDVRGNQLTALIPCRADTPPTPPADADRLGWILGYSAPTSFDALSGARAQADRALTKAISRDQPAHVHREARMTLDALADAAERPAFARSVLAPLGDPEVEPARSLISTLHLWLGSHGSSDRTARALEIHRNTVRNRLAQLSAALEVDLDDPDTRATLWLATSWLGSPGGS
ncbi:PucR family transcriptional regulator [Nocardioides panacihumi]|uniref:PucR family transcriptional regulator n=1 Tax=Nocardioides panacihumi TaxID=400774 RepID=A0ABN2RVF1_9ACTN